MNANPPIEQKTADVRLRLEPQLKTEATRILADAGLELSMAIRMFLKQVVAHRGLPFDVRQPNEVTARAMREARAIAKPRFSSAKELFDELERGAKGPASRIASKKRIHKAARKGLARASR
jgi:DNA-damage-inducible protein J